MSELLEPLYDLSRLYVLMPGKVHTQDIPVLVQKPGSDETRTARQMNGWRPGKRKPSC